MILKTAVDRSILMPQVVMQANDFDWLIHLLGELRYETNCTLAEVHGSVATPWNRMTIPRRGALPCTSASVPFASLNCGF